MQTFMNELLDMLRRCGIKGPDPYDLPPIAFHDGRQAFPGETMKQAADMGQQHFGSEPSIIFALLPDTGALAQKLTIARWLHLHLRLLNPTHKAARE